MKSDYQRSRQLAAGLGNFQPVQNGGFAGALAQGLAGFGAGYYGGKAGQQQDEVRKQLAAKLAAGDTAGAMNVLSTSGIPEYEGIGLKTQMELAQKDAERKQLAEMLGIQTQVSNVGSTPGAGAGVTPPAAGGIDNMSIGDLTKLSILDPRVKPALDVRLAQEKQTKEDNKFPDTQASASGYANRMAKAEQEIKLFEGRGYSPANDPQSYYGAGIPVAGNYLKDPQYQQYEQAASDWIRAKLRKESGAVIGKDEMAQEFKQYFPVPGDTPEVIAQKARSRAEGFNQLVAQSGNAYKTQFGGDNPYAPAGNATGQAQPPQAAQPAQPAGADANIAGALQAIQSGAPRDAVKSRLLQNGYTQEQLKAAGL